MKLLRPFASFISDLLNFRWFRYFKNYRKYWIPYAHAPTFMRTLSIRIRNWAHTECARQELIRALTILTQMLSMRISFPIFQMFILNTLSMRVRNWRVRWACASETDTYTEHSCQKLMCALSIRVRNWRVPWAYASISYAYAQHKIKIQNLKRSSLQHMLSMRVKIWCVHWAYTSGTDACTEPTRQELMRTLSMRIRN